LILAGGLKRKKENGRSGKNADDAEFRRFECVFHLRSSVKSAVKICTKKNCRTKNKPVSKWRVSGQAMYQDQRRFYTGGAVGGDCDQVHERVMLAMFKPQSAAGLFSFSWMIASFAIALYVWTLIPRWLELTRSV
jgi:hypothetical protein